jgi:hypothetical protein
LFNILKLSKKLNNFLEKELLIVIESYELKNQQTNQQKNFFNYVHSIFIKHFLKKINKEDIQQLINAFFQEQKDLEHFSIKILNFENFGEYVHLDIEISLFSFKRFLGRYKFIQRS